MSGTRGWSGRGTARRRVRAEPVAADAGALSRRRRLRAHERREAERATMLPAIVLAALLLAGYQPGVGLGVTRVASALALPVTTSAPHSSVGRSHPAAAVAEESPGDNPTGPQPTYGG